MKKGGDEEKENFMGDVNQFHMRGGVLYEASAASSKLHGGVSYVTVEGRIYVQKVAKLRKSAKNSEKGAENGWKRGLKGL